MGERNANYYIDGTSALDMRGVGIQSRTANVIEFPLKRYEETKARSTSKAVKSAMRKRRFEERRNTLRDILESSEMYCSLKLESFTGCPYALFSKGSIAALSVGSAAIAIVSLLFGA